MAHLAPTLRADSWWLANGLAGVAPWLADARLGTLMANGSILGVILIFASSQPGLAKDAGRPAPRKGERAADNPQGVDFFEKKIRPVLVKHCYECHSAQAKTLQANLALDTRAGTRQGGDSGPAVVPGDVDSSLLLDAVHYEGYEMPPDGKLPEEVIADLTQWIIQGAPDPRDGPIQRTARAIDLEAGRQFWSFRKPHRHPDPQIKYENWPETSIDRFILAQLETQGLRPVGQASKPAVLRRLYFDLIGLPPTPQQMQEFLSDDSPDAYQRVVDQLLESPHFGERWARHWLDVVRWAESAGGGRTTIFHNAWRYRDYVIDSFNSDKPYNRFVMEQIAGDLLSADSSPEQAEGLIATGFLALGPKNLDNQDKEALRMDVVDEQLDSLGRAFLGMTIGCARCHDHKFDPLPTRDYYALAGILRSTKTLTPGNVSGIVERELPGQQELKAQHQAHQRELAKLREQIKQTQAEINTLQSKVGLVGNSKSPSSRGRGVRTDGAVKPSSLPGLVVDDLQAELMGKWLKSTYHPRYVGVGYVHDDNKDKGSKSLVFRPDIPVAGRYEVRLSYTPGGSRCSTVPVTVYHADGAKTQQVNQRKAPPIDDLFVSLGVYRFDKGTSGSVALSTEGTSGHVIADAVSFLPQGQAQAATPKAFRRGPNSEAKTKSAAATEQSVEDSQAKVKGTKSKRSRDLLRKQELLEALKKDLKSLQRSAPAALARALAVAEEARPGDWHICLRGNPHKLGSVVPRGFLQVTTAGSFSEQSDSRLSLRASQFEISSKSSGRLELARWLSSPDNPLTARVMANRVWQHLLGDGLVRTPDNFGRTGQRPTHPELLDWLAVRLVEQGWSIKALIRDIVLSKVYRLSSVVPAGDRVAAAKAAAVDPENRLLWRAHRRRLDAEVLRDTILAVSGQLDLTAGGPTIRPGTTSELTYQFQSNRRSVYIPIFRNRLHEVLDVFDVADPNLVVGRRANSTRATQALFLMNSPFVMKQAEHAAARLLKMDSLNDQTARLNYVYWQTLGRKPRPSEHAASWAFLQTAVTNPDGDQNSPPDELVRWAGIYHALFACLDFRYLD